MYVYAARCRRGALTSSCDAYGVMYVCMYVCAALCRRGALTSSCDAYGVMYVCMCREVPPGGAHE